MPIKPENRALYPADWQAISRRIRFERGAGRCECDGRCGAEPHDDTRCTAVHGQPHPHTGSKVVLTAAHLDHNPVNCDDDNLMSACQRCHLNYDKEHHANSRRAPTRHPDQPALFGLDSKGVPALATSAAIFSGPVKTTRRTDNPSEPEDAVGEVPA